MPLFISDVKKKWEEHTVKVVCFYILHRHQKLRDLVLKVYFFLKFNLNSEMYYRLLWIKKI